MQREIYLDNAATTPVLAEVFEAMKPFLTSNYGNPHSTHKKGDEANRAVVFAREEMAKNLGCKSKELFFTSGASESNNQAIITGARWGKKNGRTKIITSQIEHESVLDTVDFLSEIGYEIICLEPDENGIVLPEMLRRHIDEHVALVSNMYVNNEIGTIQPIRELVKIAHEYGALFHVDAVQAVAHQAFSFRDIEADFASLTAHKFGGPKGIGALLAREHIQLESLIHGGSQERGKRAGTLNVAGIVGMNVALAHHMEMESLESKRLSALQSKLIEGLSSIPGAQLTAKNGLRTNTIVHFTFENQTSDVLLYKFSRKGLYVSAGSACSAGAHQLSHVLQSMNMDKKKMQGAIRFSLGTTTTEEDIDQAVEIVRSVLCD